MATGSGMAAEVTVPLNVAAAAATLAASAAAAVFAASTATTTTTVSAITTAIATLWAVKPAVAAVTAEAARRHLRWWSAAGGVWTGSPPDGGAQGWRRRALWRWRRNNHEGGFLRWALVPLHLAADPAAHARFAFETMCWATGKYTCATPEESRLHCAGDRENSGYKAEITIPSVVPDVAAGPNACPLRARRKLGGPIPDGNPPPRLTGRPAATTVLRWAVVDVVTGDTVASTVASAGTSTLSVRRAATADRSVTLTVTVASPWRVAVVVFIASAPGGRRWQSATSSAPYGLGGQQPSRTAAGWAGGGGGTRADGVTKTAADTLRLVPWDDRPTGVPISVRVTVVGLDASISAADIVIRFE
ncbi:hypothetical protein MMPV_007568 [Pyropia vietnamensis]